MSTEYKFKLGQTVVDVETGCQGTVVELTTAGAVWEWAMSGSKKSDDRPWYKILWGEINWLGCEPEYKLAESK